MLTLANGKINAERFVVLGAARSGLAAARLLKLKGANVLLTDDKPQQAFSEISDELKSMDVETDFGDSLTTSLKNVHCIIVSPGVPSDHDLLSKARANKIPVISEIELASNFCSAPVLAVTGTNGKTTTARLLADILSAGGKKTFLAGNIGRAFSDLVCSAESQLSDSFVVLEISSFQLENIVAFKPHIALVINIKTDHMERHQTLENYVAAKSQITLNQTKDDFLVLNADDSDCMKIATHTSASVYTFSCTREVPKGTFLQADQLILKSGGSKQFILHRLEIPIPGLHNVENALAACCAAALLKIQNPDIANAVKSFRAVEHRLEFIADVDGVSYFNDSKATNLDSLEKALLSFDKPLILIAGGQYNKNNYDAMAPLVSSKVKGLILLGEAKPYMAHAWGKAVRDVALVHNMNEAVSTAKKLARQGDIVLLSPGCKSFDQYENFEQRGNNFKNLVHKIARARKGSYSND